MIDIDFSKYEKSVISNINKENVMKIVTFLSSEKCDYIEELLEDYLDLFTFDYNDFVNKYNKLNLKYNNNLLSFVKDDMNILEEFYN